MLKNSFILLFLFASFFPVSGHSWEFEQNIILEGVLRRADRTIIKNYKGEKETSPSFRVT
jgi:hypothetical protein